MNVHPMSPGDRDAVRSAVALVLAVERGDTETAQVMLDATPNEDRGPLVAALAALPGLIWRSPACSSAGPFDELLEGLALELARGDES